MIKRTISGMIGKGSLAHNRREFFAENVDPDRVQLNICYQNENLKEVYKELFDDAVERYNTGKRKDRQITNYYEKIRQVRTRHAEGNHALILVPDVHHAV